MGVHFWDVQTMEGFGAQFYFSIAATSFLQFYFNIAATSFLQFYFSIAATSFLQFYFSIAATSFLQFYFSIAATSFSIAATSLVEQPIERGMLLNKWATN